ncbi:D-alanine--D-alanine ligase family protein [Paenibacillus sacheonensis]|uniref:D-alanine--D-alanine ligase n=1 Tax=Paenibacillus sacheonensis TaxID=742054 RepID=A0A7X4YV63_9BACL|nr:D-alanine--D-alanine ligase family protein [Paenibacillus sacheonensis]MBM7567998.1 D-alanine-D-alanine ligase [Paenibacillus sacheonensis]NBC73205.1 D-alanine--D-alanine ligase [Paenibacillus sacheonensis]
MGEKVRVGLIYGGRSGEHEVSLQTALAVMKAFDYSKYEIKPFYISKSGEWRSGDTLLAPPSDLAVLRLADGDAIVGMDALMPVFGGVADQEPDEAASISAVPAEVKIAAVSSAANGVVPASRGDNGLDVVFPLLHGTFGEDGTIQGLFEMADIPYVGAGVLASAVGMDKITMKKVFAQDGLPQCIYRYFNRTQWEKDESYYIMEIETALGYPCFIKPANLGSSVGISKARNREELIAAVNYALRFDRKVIVEEFVDAREIEVSVLGNDEPQASVVGEITSSSEFYDYKAKYIDGKSMMHIPANLPAEVSESVREMAVRAFQAIDGSGLSRVDFFLRKEDGQLFINEVNTMPGFTPYSMYPLMWKESGVSYAELLDTLIALAISRHAEKQRIDYSGGSPA